MIGINHDKTLKLEGIAKRLYDTKPDNVDFMLYKSNRGFGIIFKDKNVKVSVVFGGANYCEHYWKPFISENGSLPWTSKDFEVGVKHPENDQWYAVPNHNGEGIHPNVTFDELDEILEYVMNTPKLKIIDQASKRRSLAYRQRKITK
ncbi:MAG: hypothetical protein EBU84_07510 [Actinobacteria bacterium]|nr:hypothetical protein [Actinomycetota bacterium]